VLYQAGFLLVLGFLAVTAVINVRANMQARGIPMDFSFWDNTAGFDINQALVPYSALSTYGQAFLVGLLNTLLVAAIGLVLTTIIGFAIGIARLSHNWIVARLAMIYVETLRNVPLLLQLLFWYNAVLKPLPGPRQSLSLPFSIYLNNRGLFIPAPVFASGAEWFALAFVFGLLAAFLFWLCAHKRQVQTGKRLPVGLVTTILIIGMPLAVFFLAWQPLSFSYPELKGFNFMGGWRLLPEFVTLLLGLSLYTAAFIAEIVRAGIEAVPAGQSEAAAALGLPRKLALRYVIVPQALRVIIPPLTSQYLNLIKNSSLAVFIGYPDLVQVFAGTVLNQTGAAVQIICITMAVYLVISLATSFAMNLFNRRMALVER